MSIKKRKIEVRKHKRQLQSGKSTSVKHHTRMIEQKSIRESRKVLKGVKIEASPDYPEYLYPQFPTQKFLEENIKDESQAFEGYTEEAKKIENPNVKEIITSIAEDEKEHKEALKDIKKGKELALESTLQKEKDKIEMIMKESNEEIESLKEKLTKAKTSNEKYGIEKKISLMKHYQELVINRKNEIADPQKYIRLEEAKAEKFRRYAESIEKQFGKKVAQELNYFLD